MNNIYGLIGIDVKNSMFNAGFDKDPKTDFSGNMIASPYALQYCLKRQWDLLGENVLGLKRVQEDGTYLTLEGLFTHLTGIDSKSDYKALLENLMTFKDVKNFGCVYSVKDRSISIKGAVQFGIGINKFKDSIVYCEDVLSPYASEDGKANTTIGNRNLLNEAHYLYDFSIFADEYKNLGIEYTYEDYKDLKDNLLICVSNYNSKSKKGCKNEFALFIEINDNKNYLIDLSSLTEYVDVFKDEDECLIYDLKELSQLVDNLKTSIKSTEVFYNPRTMKIKNTSDSFKIYDLITRKALK